MIDVTTTINAPLSRVWAVLADGWTYPGWVVGATHMRAVDDGWPAVGTFLHHSVGPWPLVMSDKTEVLAVEPERLLELKARLWPLGAARIRLELSSVDATRTRVRMSEQATEGPTKILPQSVQAALLIPRNRESLARLSSMAENGAR
jgi:uncharacterized protein YndB with AHSA1/START domain